MRRWLLNVCCLSACVAAAMRCELHAAGPPDFDTQIAPLLASRCLDCHSGAEAKGKLNLSSKQSALTGGESGPAIVAANLADSQLWQRVDAGDMPPKHPLPEAERALLRAWIEAGAPWGSDPIDPFRFSTSSRAGVDWWSLQPLRKVAPPTVADFEAATSVEQPVNALDSFVREKLAAAKLAPSPPADRRTLVRRLSFDLLGLPPRPAEVEAFVDDPAPDAYERLVDRMLASPQYGERWARHWLDVARFGESDGFEFDHMRPNAWRYRDWVIDAFNRDLPYDQFARLQLAGDVLLPDDPQGLAAVGYLVAGGHDSLLPAGDTMRAIMRQDELEDVVGNVSQTFLGLTVHCARCHDHKFDPIAQREYYQLASALGGVKRGDRPLQAASPPAWLVDRGEQLRANIVQLEEPARTAILARRGEAAASIRPPQPIAAWSFDADGSDSIGSLHLTLQGGASVVDGRLQLNGEQAVAVSPPLPVELKAKTLEAWVQLASLEQRGGGVVGVQSLDGAIFDSIVFGERDPAHWTAGSEFFSRTQHLQGAAETEANQRPVHIAIVYAADGQVRAYRDGQPYGAAYASPGPRTFGAGEAQVMLGVRHSPAGRGKMLGGSIDRVRLYDRALTAEEIAASADVMSTAIDEAQLLAELTTEQQQQRVRLKQQLASVGDQLMRWKQAKIFTLTPQQPAPSHLLLRGNPQQPAEVVSPAGLAAITGAKADFQLPPDAPEAERRVRLAQWIAGADNPLFARTMVNRLWLHHFGRGLVDTPNDLGFSGGLPTHPELLDYLAGELVRSGYSIKALQRLIVTSAAYRQQSLPRADAMAVDADNRLLWRMSPRRVDAESLRDAMLTLAGELNPAHGGPSFQDFRAFNRGGTQFYELEDRSGWEFQRRSIYRMWARGGKQPLLDTFDCPDPSTSTPKRSATTTPLQALSLLNGPFTLRMADAMADRLERTAAGDVPLQVERAFQLASSRSPTPEELAPSIDFVQRRGLAAFCRVLMNSNAFLYVD